MRAFLKDRAGIAVFTAALVVQSIGLAQFWHESPFAKNLILDAYRYDALARELASGGFPMSAPFHQAPLYPHAVAIVYALSGGSLGFLYIVQAFLGAVCALLLYRVTSRAFGRRAGVLAGFLGVLCQPLLAFAPRVLPAVPVVALELLFLDHAPDADDPSRRRWILAGVLAGLLCIAQPSHLLLVPFAVGWLLLRRRRLALRPLLAFLVPAALVIAPVTLHNLRSDGSLVLVSSNGGETFYHGNNERAAGTYSLMAGLESADILEQARIAREIAESDTGHPMNAAAVSRYWFAEGLRFAREHPAAYLHLELRKLRLMLGGDEAPDIYSPRFEAMAYTPLYRIGIAHLPFLLPLALAGLVLMGRRCPGWLVALLLTHVATLMLFYVSNRYRLPLEVLLLVPSAVALARIYERRTQFWLLPGAVVVIALLLTTSADDARAARGKILVNLGASLGKREAYAEAEQAFRAALSQDPEWARARHYLGRSLAMQGRNDEAIAAYEEASRLAPDALDIRLDLVTALGRGGRAAEAAESLETVERVAASRNDVTVLERAAQLWLALGDPARAADTFASIAERRPDAAVSWERLGVARGLAGDSAGAREALARAIELDPSRPSAWEALVRALVELGRCAEAQARIDEAPARTGAPPAAFDAVRGELRRICGE